MGRLRERSFHVGRTLVRLALMAPVRDEAHADRAAEMIRKAAAYLRNAFGRDLGPQYLVVAAPETPEGKDIIGEGWAHGQGRTLLPISTERLRAFAEDYVQAYVRYEPYRTEIRRPEEFWLVDAITKFYSRRAVARAGLADDDAVARGLAVGYMKAVTTPGVNSNLEQFSQAGQSDQLAHEAIGPFMLFLLDQKLRAGPNSAGGLDSVLRRFFSRRQAGSLWTTLPRSRSDEWKVLRAEYVRGREFVPVPDLFPLAPTRDRPTPLGGEVFSHFSLVYTGNTEGYLENCGCKANESGGIARRATVLDSIRGREPEALLLDAGSSIDVPDQYQTASPLAEREQRFYLEMMDRMGYSAAAIGIGELARGPEYLREQTRGLHTPFITANVLQGGELLGPASIQLPCQGRRVLLIGVFEPPRGGKSQLVFDKQLTRLTTKDPITAVRDEIRGARPPPDLVIVLGKVSPLTVRRLADACPEIGVIVSTDSGFPLWKTGGDARHRVILEEDQPGFIGSTLVLYTDMGQYGLTVARLSLDKAGRIVGVKLHDSWLTDAVHDQDGIRRALNAFYDRVGVSPEAQAGFRTPLSGDPYWQGKRFVGARACRGCHEQEYQQWRTTPHASAYKTLLDKHRHYQPVCISCHVVGFGSANGYRVGQPEDPMGNVQCEMCHGPGAEHAATSDRSTIRRHVPESVCLECHNPEHSDRFIYAERLPMVLHHAVDRVSAR